MRPRFTLVTSTNTKSGQFLGTKKTLALFISHKKNKYLKLIYSEF